MQFSLGGKTARKNIFRTELDNVDSNALFAQIFGETFSTQSLTEVRFHHMIFYWKFLIGGETMIAGSLFFLKPDFFDLKTAVAKVLGPARKAALEEDDKRSVCSAGDDGDHLFSESFYWGIYPYF